VAVDRKLWAESFTNDLPHWPCPTCGKGHLLPLEDKFFFEETGPSKDAHEHEAWEPDWITKRVGGFLQCGIPSCRELVSISGRTSKDFYQVDWDEYVDNDIIKIEFIAPAPIPIALPEDTPQSIVEAIHRASTLIWSSPESSANQIRQAVECMMDHFGIPGKDASGRPVHLHNRIVEFEKTDAENGAVLLATKWLGNTGSHFGGISHNDALDAFDMIEFVIQNKFDTAKAALMAKAAAINAAKGPIAIP
jgi:Domain of unknown function (DUF4145)